MLFHLRDAFRAGDVWLARSRRYGDIRKALLAAPGFTDADRSLHAVEHEGRVAVGALDRAAVERGIVVGDEGVELEREALETDGVDAVNVYHDLAAGGRDDRPGARQVPGTRRPGRAGRSVP